MSDHAMAVDDAKPHRTLVRGETVRHISTDIIGATKGVVLAVFTDLQMQPYAAVQWYGGSLTLTQLFLLERTAPAPYRKH